MRRTMEHFIMDLDGCFTCDKWRFEKVDHSIDDLDERYHEYNSNCHLDKPANISVLIKESSTMTPLIVTARPERYRQQTFSWLLNNVPFKTHTRNTLMRPNGNYLSSPDIKKLLVEQWLSHNKHAKIVLAYDDRDDIIEMYESIGIKGVKLLSEKYKRVHS